MPRAIAPTCSPVVARLHDSACSSAPAPAAQPSGEGDVLAICSEIPRVAAARIAPFALPTDETRAPSLTPSAHSLHFTYMCQDSTNRAAAVPACADRLAMHGTHAQRATFKTCGAAFCTHVASCPGRSAGDLQCTDQDHWHGMILHPSPGGRCHT
jgi:hypothetical protein